MLISIRFTRDEFAVTVRLLGAAAGCGNTACALVSLHGSLRRTVSRERDVHLRHRLANALGRDQSRCSRMLCECVFDEDCCLSACRTVAAVSRWHVVPGRVRLPERLRRGNWAGQLQTSADDQHLRLQCWLARLLHCTTRLSSTRVAVRRRLLTRAVPECLQRPRNLRRSCRSLEHSKEFQQRFLRTGPEGIDICRCAEPWTGPTCETQFPRGADGVLPYGEIYPGWLFAEAVFLANSKAISLRAERKYWQGVDPFQDAHPLFNMSRIATLRVTVKQEDLVYLLNPAVAFNEARCARCCSNPEFCSSPVICAREPVVRQRHCPSARNPR